VSDRFYCPDPSRDGRYYLTRDESRHLTRVCRLGAGDRVEIFDGRGFVTGAEIVAASVDRVELVAVGGPIVEHMPACSFVLATAIPKGDRLDWLVEKAVELGVDRFIPMIAERSVVVPRDTKLDRLRRTIVEASKQCGRPRLMVLEEPVEWSALVTTLPVARKFLADRRGAPAASWRRIERGQVVALAVGPEGGFTESERARAIDADWFPIRLGYSTLRVETAGLAGVAALLARVPETDE
jgi:16S rRNA (uracil1498-N3)-methyltransferase